MRVVRSNGLSARAMLVAALALVFLSAPPVVHAATDVSKCYRSISPNMEIAYRALETRQYADAYKAFSESANEYGICAFYHSENPNGIHAIAPELAGWQAYATAGMAAAAFGMEKTADGLRHAKQAEEWFGNVMSGDPWGEASASVRRAASDGLAYVRSLAAAKKPILPKIWLDWKAAHPSG
jgi:hypothetical protein